LLHDSLPAPDCMDWWSYPLCYLFQFFKSIGNISTDGQKIIIIIIRFIKRLRPWLQRRSEVNAIWLGLC